MRTFIVDTHTLAWFVSRDRRLSAKARTVLRDPNARHPRHRLGRDQVSGS